MLYTILAGAKRHHIEPWAYVRDLLLRLHADDPCLEEMLPDRWAHPHPPGSPPCPPRITHVRRLFVLTTHGRVSHRPGNPILAALPSCPTQCQPLADTPTRRLEVLGKVAVPIPTQTPPGQDTTDSSDAYCAIGIFGFES